MYTTCCGVERDDDDMTEVVDGAFHVDCLCESHEISSIKYRLYCVNYRRILGWTTATTMTEERTRSRPAHPAAPTAQGSTDPRVYLDQVSRRWRYEDDQGDEWEWQPVTRRKPDSTQEQEEEDGASTSAAASSSSSAKDPSGIWVAVLDDELISAQQQAYSVAGVDEAAPVTRRPKKRSAAAVAAEPSAESSSTLPPSKRPKPVTSLYVTGLPLDSMADEIATVFSRYGLLLEDDEGKPRIKMYYDDKTSMFRGEALVVYFKPESVDLAIKMLDDTHLRAALGQTSGPSMRVQRAEFPVANPPPKPNSQARTSSSQAEQNNSTPGQGNKRNLTDQERKKIQRRVARMEDKLADWRDSDSEAEDESLRRASHIQGRSDVSAQSITGRTVVLTKMFTLFELEEDPTLLLDLKEEVREECSSTIGPVTNVVLWDKEPEGIMTVRFTTPEHARRCVEKMKGRFFAARTIDAFIITSKPRFRRTTGQDDADNDEDNEAPDGNNDLQRRQDQFGAWLETE